MPDYRVFETAGFVRDLEQDFSGQKEKIRKKLRSHVYPQLRCQPYFGKNIRKLFNYQPDTWRYRVGDYRFFYQIDDPKKVVTMLAADNRKNAY